MLKQIFPAALLSVSLVTTNADASREFITVMHADQIPGAGNSTGTGVGVCVLTFGPGDWSFNYSIYVTGFDFGAYFYGEPVTYLPGDDVLGFRIGTSIPGQTGASVYSVLQPDFEAGVEPTLKWLYPTVVRITGSWDLVDGDPDGAAPATTGVGNLDYWARPMLAAWAGDSLPLYFEIRTTDFPDGAIRGQLVAVPEPETVSLLLGGLALGAAVRWRAIRQAVVPI